MRADNGFGAVCGAALLCTAIVLVLKSFGKSAVGATAALSVLALLTVGANGLRGVYGELFSIIGGEDISGYASSAARIVGVGYLSSATADVCTELGESGIGKALSTCGSVEMLLIALPYFIEVLRLGIDLLGALP